MEQTGAYNMSDVQAAVCGLRMDDYDYPLPEERIALHPLQERDMCRLLVSAPDGSLYDRRFDALPSLLPPGAVVYANDTRVINARMAFRKATGAAVEVFLLEPLRPADYVRSFESTRSCVWSCMVGNLKRWKEGTLAKSLDMGGGRRTTLRAERLEALEGNAHAVRFDWDGDGVSFAEIVAVAGNIPIPPYLRRPSEAGDADDYQTVYSAVQGSVAAPTAGLHFTPRLLAEMEARGIPLHRLTLHVGAGTFQPVKSDTIGGHPMHTETFVATLPLVDSLLDALASRRPVTAVGTTSVRTLESLPLIGVNLLLGAADPLHVSQWQAYGSEAAGIDTADALRALRGWLADAGGEAVCSTAILIAPGFGWRLTDVLITNFHQPRSTLLLLVSSFLDRCPAPDSGLQWRHIYRHALGTEGYRFLSYGDACLLMPRRR